MKRNLFVKLIVVLMTIALLTGCQSSGAVINSSDGQKDTVEAGDNATEKEDTVESGSDKSTDGDDKETGNTPVNQGITVNQIEFEVIDIATLSEELLSEIEALKVQKGYEFWQQEDGSFLILISAGEKLTGGYGIEVESIEDNEGKTYIYVKETEPEGDMNLQALTYPFVVIKAAGITDQFVILDQDQNEYPRMAAVDQAAGDGSGLFDTVLRLSEDFQNPVTGIYQGQIDNHSIEVLVGEEYMTFSADDIGQFLKGIEVGDKIEIMRAISPSDQVTVESITKVQ